MIFGKKRPLATIVLPILSRPKWASVNCYQGGLEWQLIPIDSGAVPLGSTEYPVGHLHKDLGFEARCTGANTNSTNSPLDGCMVCRR